LYLEQHGVGCKLNEQFRAEISQTKDAQRCG
jgi:hypothetical protein